MSSLSNSRRWQVVPADRTAEEDLAVALGISPLVARIMVARGIRDVDAARRFLTPSLDRDWGNPLDIPGMGEVADRVGLALDRGEEIVRGRLRPHAGCSRARAGGVLARSCHHGR